MDVKSLSDCIEFEFEGNILKESMCLADVDGDQLNELVVGNDSGEIGIFKSEFTKPVWQASICGTVSCIAFGDALNLKRGVLVVVTTCGHLQVYDLVRPLAGESPPPATNRFLGPVHSQRVMANIKSMLIGDVNGDNCCELIVGLTDRVVRTYRWFTSTADHHHHHHHQPLLGGKFLSVNKWDFADQVGGLALHRTPTDWPCLLVSQPGGSFHCITVAASSSDSMRDDTESDQSYTSLSRITLECENSSKIRNAEICGNVRTVRQAEGGTFIIATLDGLLMRVESGKVLWQVDVQHPLFFVSCVDITGSGVDAIVACAWDGATFLLQEGFTSVKFLFKEAISSFTAGTIGHMNEQRPCVVYATFNNKIFVYYNLELAPKTSKSLCALERTDGEFCDILQRFKIDCNPSNLKKLNNLFLYHYNG